MVVRSRVTAPETTTAEARDLEVNGTLMSWTQSPRHWLIQQASRCIKRTAEDQSLNLALQNQVEAEHRRAEAQREHRIKRVQQH